MTRYRERCGWESDSSCDANRREFDRLHAGMENADVAAVIAAADAIDEVCRGCPHAASDMANVFLGAEDYAGAGAILDDLLDSPLADPSEALDLKGRVVAERDGPEFAIPWFERAIALDPDDHPANCHLGATYCRLERYSEAVPYVTKAFHLDPSCDFGVNFAAMALAETQAKDELVNLAEQVEKESWELATEANIAKALSRIEGLETETLAWCRRILQHDPDMIDALCIGATAAMLADEDDESIRLLERLAELDPEIHGAFCSLNLANMYGGIRSDWPRALQVMVNARVRFPADEDVEGYLAFVLDRVTGTLEEGQGETERWRRRFEALSAEHSSLRDAIAEMHSASTPGIPLGIALVEGEGQAIEFMRGYPENARELAKEIAAFSTSNDGSIFLGVDNDGTIIGLPDVNTIEQKDALVNRISGVASSAVDPPATVAVAFLAAEGSTVARIFIGKGPRPVYYSSDVPYVRVLDRSRPATPEEVEELVRQG